MSDEPDQTSEVVVRQPAREVSPAVPTADGLPIANHACPKLSEAVGLARDRCKAAAKESWNDFQKYKYASADEVIQTAKSAMEGLGLALIPQLQELTTVGSGNKTIYGLNRTIFLTHSSGEYVPLTVRGWPVIEDRGRPLDKAFAIALTTSLSYLLRDLLQMPREDGTDMNQRDDRKAEPAPAPRPAPQTIAKPTANGPTPIQAHAKAIEEAETLNELKRAWDWVNIASGAGKLNANDIGRLNALKESRKRALTPREPGMDGDPEPTLAELAARDEAEARKAATR